VMKLFSGPPQGGREAAGSVSDHAAGSSPAWGAISAACGSSRGIKSVREYGVKCLGVQPGAANGPPIPIGV